MKRPRQIKPCPRCKASHGWRERIQQSYDQYYLADGNGSHVVDDINRRGRGGSVKYCAECGKVITDCIAET